MDEVPIPLKAFLPSALPADHEILQSITEAVRHQRS
jgi:formylmethanofuran dehydrogenase subunit B